MITGAPNFPKGRVFDGYRNKLWQVEEMSGIRVLRVWTYITANAGFFLRIADYVSYMMAAILGAVFVRRVDLIVATSPQLFTPCAAYVVSQYKRVPYVFELRDLWPESIRTVGAMKDSIVLRLLERLELFLYRKAAAIVSVTHSFRDNLIGRGIDRSKINVVTNGVDLSRFKPIHRDAELAEQFGLTGKFVAGYIGTHGMAHALDTLLEAADLMRQKEGGDSYRFLFLGDGACKAALIAKASQMRLSNVVFIDSVPKEDVVRYWSLLDVAIIHLRKTPLFTTVIPSKLFECMGMGIPVLHGVAGESAGIVEREGVGIVFEPENATELCASLSVMRNDLAAYETFRANGLRAARHYDRSALAANMLGVLEALALPKPTSTIVPSRDRLP